MVLLLLTGQPDGHHHIRIKQEILAGIFFFYFWNPAQFENKFCLNVDCIFMVITKAKIVTVEGHVHSKRWLQKNLFTHFPVGSYVKLCPIMVLLLLTGQPKNVIWFKLAMLPFIWVFVKSNLICLEQILLECWLYFYGD
jgi:hypothetical protein